MTYKEARKYLEEVSKYGSILGLDTIQNLLEELDNPQADLKFIHIAGTNGKGSVLAYTSTILSEAGYRIGRYVSPTVVSYLERIQVDGVWIPEEIFAELVGKVRKAIARMEAKGQTSPTVFEVETAIAFLYFKRMKCDLVTLETGLGGVLDATNIVVNTVVSVFASISMDHMGFLGDTLEEIAANKAGIMKKGCKVVTTVQKPEVMNVLRQQAARLDIQDFRVVQPDKAERVKESWEGQTFSYGALKNIELPLVGEHQTENAMTALEVIGALTECGYPVSEDAIRKGFANTRWPGRFTCICESPLFFVDGAHNEDAAIRLHAVVTKLFPKKRLIFIMGVFKDKEYEKIAARMAPLAECIYTVNLPNEERTLDAEELCQTVGQYCDHSIAVYNIEEAVRLAMEDACMTRQDKAAEEAVVIAFGSLSYLADVKKAVVTVHTQT